MICKLFCILDRLHSIKLSMSNHTHRGKSIDVPEMVVCGFHLLSMTLKRQQRYFAALLGVTLSICCFLEMFCKPELKLIRPPYILLDKKRVTMDYRQRGGRIGNLMFMYASLFGIAESNDMTPILPVDFPLRNVFSLPMKIGDENSIGMHVKYDEYGMRSSAYDMHAKSLDHLSTVLFGYFQSWKYFRDVDTKLRDHFKFRRDTLNKVQEFFAKSVPIHYRDTSYVKVGLHVRRADIMVDYYVNYGYTTADVSYIKRAMHYFKSRFTKLLFVVCSDDIKWCKNSIPADENVIFSTNKDPEVDLAILASCQHTIMTVGSFGWWAAWLTNGTTIYYKKWPRPVSKLEYMVEKRDYFYPWWIPM